MKRLVQVFVIGICLLLPGCGQKKQKAEETGNKVYCLDTTETKILSEDIELKGNETMEQVKECLQYLTETPEDLSYVKVIPDDVEVLDYELNENEELSLYFDGGYRSLTGISEILRRAAIVKTICQVDGVTAVQFYVDGQPLSNSEDVAVGYMKEEDFIDNTDGETAYRQEAELTMYFASADGESLVAIPIVVSYDATISLEQMVLEQLIKGPYDVEGIDKAETLPTVPEGTELNKVTVKDGICYVDFSSDFLKRRGEITSEVAIYSIVNSLVELPRVNKVQFVIDGENVEMFMENQEFDIQFERNLDLLAVNEETE